MLSAPPPFGPKGPALLLVLLLLGSPGCTSTRQIETTPPQPAQPTDEPMPAAPNRSTLVIQLATGTTPLPEEVSTLRFQLAEVRLKPADGDWTTYPADVNRFEIYATSRPRKTVLSTKLPPVAYDSLALVLNDVFVQYGPNAGGPLTLPREEPLRLAFPLSPLANQTTVLHLTLEPGASLSHDEDCRWFFLPFITAEIEQ